MQQRELVVIPIAPAPILAAHSRQQPESNSPILGMQEKRECCASVSPFFSKEGCEIITAESPPVAIPQLLFSENLSLKDVGFLLESVPPRHIQMDVA